MLRFALLFAAVLSITPNAHAQSAGLAGAVMEAADQKDWDYGPKLHGRRSGHRRSGDVAHSVRWRRVVARLQRLCRPKPRLAKPETYPAPRASAPCRQVSLWEKLTAS